MDAFEHALLAVAALVAAGLLSMRGRWATGARTREDRLLPERRIHVTADGTGIVCTYPDGAIMKVAWPEIARVEIRTTSGGPLVADVFWEIYATESTPRVVYPSGATGEQAVLDAMGARLPGFDHRAVAAAMGCAQSRTFTLWQIAAVA